MDYKVNTSDGSHFLTNEKGRGHIRRESFNTSAAGARFIEIITIEVAGGAPSKTISVNVNQIVTINGV